MSVIWLLIKASWLNVVVATLAGAISGGCSAWLIALINTAIAQNAPLSLLPLFVGLAVVALVTSSLSQFVLIDLAQDAVYRLRLQLSQRIMAAPLHHLEKLGPNQLLAVLTEDVQSISNIVFVIPFICIDIAVVLGCLVYLGWLSGWVFLAVLVFMLGAIALVQLLLNHVYRYIELARKEIDRLFQHFRTLTDGIKELKLNTQRKQTFFDEDLAVSTAASRRYQKTALKLAAVTSGGGQILFFTLVGLLLFGIPQLIPSTQAILPSYILTLTFLMGPIQKLIEQLPSLTTANVAIQKVTTMGLNLAESAEISTVMPQPQPQQWYNLTLDRVTHAYHTDSADHAFTLGPIDLTLKAGEIVFIVGGNGSGKSTLAKLITGLYMPNSGELRLDGQPITDANLEWYRQHFSAIFSDFFLFDRLISHNTLTPDQQAQRYLEKLELDQKVSVQDGRLSTTALSQGQRKRLALLTAYLDDRPIYLFDEWAADQDPIFRDIFYHQLLHELKQRGKTVLVISHDDHYFHVGDRLIKLDQGRVESDKWQ